MIRNRAVRRAAGLLLALALMLTVLLTVSAETYSDHGITLPFPDGYEVLTVNDLSKHAETVRALGYDASSLSKYMKDKGIAAIAVGDPLTDRFIFKYEQSDFTGQTGSFNDFDDSSLARFNEQLFGGSGGKKTLNGAVWLRAKCRVESSPDIAYQYVTVQNGALYSVAYYGDSSEPLEAMMEKVRIKRSGDGDFSSTLLLIILIAVSVAGLVLLGFLGVSLWRDWKKRGDKKDEEGGIVIKRRRIRK